MTPNSKGSLYLRGNYRDGKIGELAVVLHHIDIEDRQGRYELRDLDGQAGNNGEPSRLSLAGARWHKLPVGAMRAELRWDASGVTLQKPCTSRSLTAASPSTASPARRQLPNQRAN